MKSAIIKTGNIMLFSMDIKSIILCFIYIICFGIAVGDALLFSQFDGMAEYALLCASLGTCIFGSVRKIRCVDKVFLLFIAFTFIATLFGDLEYIPKTLMQLFTCMVFFSMSEESFNIFVKGSTCIGIVVLLRMIYTYAERGISYYMGNRVPLHVVAIGLVLLYYLCEKKQINIVLNLGIAVFLLVIVVVSASRTSMLGVMTYIVVLLFLYFRDRFSVRKLFLLVFLSVLCFAIVYYNFDFILQRLFAKQSTATASVDSRSLMWIDVFSSISFWGYKPNYILTKYGVGNVHNSFVQAYTSFGVFPFLLFVMSILKSLFIIIKNRIDKSYMKLGLVVVPFLVMSMFESFFFIERGYQFLGVLFCVVVGRVYAMNSENQSI